MAVLKSKDNKDLLIDCSCGCDSFIRFRLEKDDDYDMYMIMSYTNGTFYSEQRETIFYVIKKKLKIQ